MREFIWNVDIGELPKLKAIHKINKAVADALVKGVVLKPVVTRNGVPLSGDDLTVFETNLSWCSEWEQ